MQEDSGVFLNVSYNRPLHRPQPIPYIVLSIRLYNHICFRFHITYAFQKVLLNIGLLLSADRNQRAGKIVPFSSNILKSEFLRAAYSSSLKVEAVNASETSRLIYQTISRYKQEESSSSSSSCSLRVRRFSCSLIPKLELVPPSLLRLSHVPSSLRSVFQCLSWYSISVHPLYLL